MAETETKKDSIQVDFSDIVKKAYEKGLKETGMTVDKCWFPVSLFSCENIEEIQIKVIISCRLQLLPIHCNPFKFL